MNGVDLMRRVGQDRIGSAAAFKGPADAISIVGGYGLRDHEVALKIEFVSGGEDVVVDIKINDALGGDGGGGGSHGKKGGGISPEPFACNGLDASLGADGGVGGNVGDYG